MCGTGAAKPWEKVFFCQNLVYNNSHIIHLALQKMTQTIWIAVGTLVVLAIGFFLYVSGGVSGEPNIVSATPELMIEDKTLVMSNKKSVTNTESKEVVLHTSMGDFTILLYKEDAPKTVENFVKLAGEGFYNGVKFHRVIKGFMNQTGDPLSKDESQMNRWGTGGPGYQFEDEIDPQSEIYKKGYKVGVVAMANSGPNTNGSQFFIMAADYPLPPLYAIFGEVTKGLDVVGNINNVKTTGAPNDRPIEPVTVTSVEVK